MFIPKRERGGDCAACHVVVIIIVAPSVPSFRRKAGCQATIPGTLPEGAGSACVLLVHPRPTLCTEWHAFPSWVPEAVPSHHWFPFLTSTWPQAWPPVPSACSASSQLLWTLIFLSELTTACSAFVSVPYRDGWGAEAASALVLPGGLCFAKGRGGCCGSGTTSTPSAQAQPEGTLGDTQLQGEGLPGASPQRPAACRPAEDETHF